MKKFKLLLLLMFMVMGLVGCTVNLSTSINDSDDKDDNNIDIIDDEDVFLEDKITSVGAESSLNNPLNIGEYGIASKYNVVLDEYKNVDVTVKTIYENAEEIVSEYNFNNPDDIIEKKDNYKLVVLDYEVVFFDFETESFGNDILLDVEIVDSTNNNFVVNGIKQVIDVKVLREDVGIVDGGKGVVQVVFAIPNDVTNYLIKFGTKDHTIAYYKV